MNDSTQRAEATYRKTGKVLIVLVATWLMLLFLLVVVSKLFAASRLPTIIIMDCGVPIVFIAIAVTSFVRAFAYMRWKNRYPYGFLFANRSRSESSTIDSKDRDQGQSPK
jgi:hypothetical protein